MMSGEMPMYPDCNEWTVDNDGVQYDTSLFRRQDEFLVPYHKRDRGCVRIPSAKADYLSLPSAGLTFPHEHDYLPREGDYFVLYQPAGQELEKLAAIPAESVEQPAYAGFPPEGHLLAAQRDLLAAWQRMHDAIDKIGTTYPDEGMALDTLRHDLWLVLRYIEDRRGAPQDRNAFWVKMVDGEFQPRENLERVFDLIDGPACPDEGGLGVDGRFGHDDHSKWNRS